MIYGVRRNHVKGISYLKDEPKPKVYRLDEPKPTVCSYFLKMGHDKKFCSLLKAFNLKILKKKKNQSWKTNLKGPIKI